MFWTMHSILIVLSCHVMTCTQFKLPREKFYRENGLKGNKNASRKQEVQIFDGSIY